MKGVIIKIHCLYVLPFQSISIKYFKVLYKENGTKMNLGISGMKKTQQEGCTKNIEIPEKGVTMCKTRYPLQKNILKSYVIRPL